MQTCSTSPPQLVHCSRVRLLTADTQNRPPVSADSLAETQHAGTPAPTVHTLHAHQLSRPGVGWFSSCCFTSSASISSK